MKIKKSDMIMFLFLLFINFILSFAGVVKYILALVIIVLFALKYRVNIKENNNFIIPVLVYICVGIIGWAIQLEFSIYYFRMLLFLIVPFVFSLLVSAIANKNLHKLIYIQLYSLIFIYCIIEKLADESQYAFVFGVFFIFILFDDRISKKIKFWNATLILFLIELFTGKRLVSLICILVILVYMMCRKKENIKTKRLNGLNILFLVILMIYIYLCKNGLAHTITEKYNILTSGREWLYDSLSQYYKFSPLYFGKGTGWVYYIFNKYNILNNGNLHNDILMAYIDLGFFGFVIWINSYKSWWNKLNNSKVKIIMFIIYVYTIINFMSDNIMIYINYWFSVYLILFYLKQKDRNENIIS